MSKGRLLGPDKLKNHTNEEKGKDRKKKEQGGRKEGKRKKKWFALFLFKTDGYFE